MKEGVRPSPAGLAEMRAQRTLLYLGPDIPVRMERFRSASTRGLFPEHFGHAVEVGTRCPNSCWHCQDRLRGQRLPQRGRGEGGPEGRGEGGPAWAGLSSRRRRRRRLCQPRGPREPGRRRLHARVLGLRCARMSGFLEELLGEKLVTGGGEEVDVHSLSARGISLLGLYFGCSLSAPCAQLSASLAAFYGRLRGDAAAGPGAGAGPGPGAGAAAEPEPRRRLEIVFVSSDQDQRQWQDFVRDMPWLALPYKEKHRKVSGAGLVGAPGLGAHPVRSPEPGRRRPLPANPPHCTLCLLRRLCTRFYMSLSVPFLCPFPPLFPGPCWAETPAGTPRCLCQAAPAGEV